MSRRRPTSAVPSRACEVLEPWHPLARASRRALHAVERVTSAAIFGGAGTTFLLVAGHAAAPSFAIASAIVTTAAGLAMLAARASLRAAATHAIAVGDDRVGVRELDLTRRRLTSRKFRTQLARTLETYAQTREPGYRRAWEPVLTCTPSPAAREAMSAVSALLRSESAPSPRVIARCSRLVTAGHDSPLYGDDGADSAALDCELRCIRYHADSSGYEDALQAPEPHGANARRPHAQ